MPNQYTYRALTPTGQESAGVMTADSSARVLDQLTTQGMMPIEVKIVPPRRSVKLFGFMRGGNTEELITFTSNLSTMYKAGIPILRALSMIKIGDQDSRINQAIDTISAGMQNGQPLSEAMSSCDNLFSEVYITSVAAGEEAGKLDDVLDELAIMLEQELELSRAIKSGVRYPVMVICAVIAAFFVLVLYVVPRFMGFYGKFGAELPLPTRILIGMHTAITTYWPIALALLVISVFSLKKILATESGKAWFDNKLLQLPVFGNLVTKGNIARFTIMFHIMFQSGLPIVRTLTILGGSIKNSGIAADVKHLAELLREGRDKQLVSSEFKYFPEIALQMMAVGLESGSLGDMLKEISKHFSREVHYTSRQLTAILEPMLTLVMGGFILLLALAIFMPMWNLIKVFNN